PHRGVAQHRGERGLLQQSRVVVRADGALMHAGDRIAPQRGVHERNRGVEHDAADEGQARAEPEKRLPAAASHFAAATAFCWSWSRTCLALPPGCTARPMFCCTSSFTPSHAGSVVGARRAFGKASRYGLSALLARMRSSPDFVTGRKPSAVIHFVMLSGW